MEDVPVESVVPCPVVRFHIVGVDDDIALALGTVLELLQVSVHGGAEGDILRHGGHVEVANQLQPLAFGPFCLRERPVVLGIRAERVADFPVMDVLVVHLHILVALDHFRIGVGEVEVFDIPGVHFVVAFREITLLADVHQVHILPLSDGVGHETQGVTGFGGGKI